MRRLTSLGVDVRLGVAVQVIDEKGVVMGNERVRAKTVVWTAGVAPSPAGKWLGTVVDRAGRVRIQPDITVPEHADIFVYRRHGIARSRRPPVMWSRASCDAARQVSGDVHHSEGRRTFSIAPVSLF
jgi:glycine/D-amino acid oxidase-like deaminating enzyme